MSKNFCRNFFAFSCVFMLSLLFVGTLFAQEAVPLDLPTPLPKPENPEIYKIPETDNPEELMMFLVDLIGKEPEDKLKLADVFNEIGDKILKAEPGEELEKTAVSLKLNSLFFRMQENASEKSKLDEYIAKLEKEPKYKDVAEQGKAMLFQHTLSKYMEKDKITTEEFNELKKQAIPEATEDEGKDMQKLLKLFIFAQFSLAAKEKMDDPKPAIDTVNEMIERLKKAEEPQVQFVVSQIERTLKREELVGKELEIEGFLLNGDKFDWKSLRGKVVLVDFWATWCGPCIMEVPNMTEMYEKYKDKGFEILGISIDEDIDELKTYIEEAKTPWIILAEKLSEEKEGITNPSDTYEVMSIPTMFLVDREGKVVSVNARGENLKKLLEKQFEEKKEEKDEK